MSVNIDSSLMSVNLREYLESKACATPHRSLKSLKAALLKAGKEIPVTMLRDIVGKVPERLKACIKAKGGYFDI
uniref:Uncharacterized protein n=1 Tax=Acrobeloides nanus TaxID=290746 RepID=A0A914CS45_9BILA